MSRSVGPATPKSATSRSDPKNMTLRLEIRDGEYTLFGDGEAWNVGQVEVVEDHVTFTGEISARWSFDGTKLTSQRDRRSRGGQAVGCDTVIVWGAHPWERVEAA